MGGATKAAAEARALDLVYIKPHKIVLQLFRLVLAVATPSLSGNSDLITLA